MIRTLIPVLVLLLVCLGCTKTEPVTADEKPAPKKGKKSKARPLVRLFVQDLETTSLKWGDVMSTGGELALGPLTAVPGLKALDAEKQKLVQMAHSAGHICVGVRDDESGKHESGWALIRTGVGYIDHGDHGHWTFKKKPEVVDSRLDKEQGNPAHLYLYDGKFYLANDGLNGYTRIDPAKYEGDKKDAPRFIVGGGNHITLAVVDDKVGYGCWIDGGGPNKGRVDVTPVTDKPRSEPAYRFTLPTGSIHGAIANSGKVFFAPGDGICWVDADLTATRKPEDVKIHHIPLGKDGEKARRTGAFVNHKNHVLFVTGKDASSALVLLDAKQADPKPLTVPLEVSEGTRAVTPAIATTVDGKSYAFIFHDRAKDSDAEEVLSIVALDDKDGPRVVKRLKVGKSAVEGHYGHHDIAFDAEGRYGFFTNPGDGTLSVLSLKSLEIVGTFKVGGKPTALIACGSLETDD